jgi:hypothetical protein
MDLERSLLVVRWDHPVPLRTNIGGVSAMTAHIDLRAAKRRGCSAVHSVTGNKLPPTFSALHNSCLNAPRSRTDERGLAEI